MSLSRLLYIITDEVDQVVPAAADIFQNGRFGSSSHSFGILGRQVRVQVRVTSTAGSELVPGFLTGEDRAPYGLCLDLLGIVGPRPAFSDSRWRRCFRGALLDSDLSMH